MAAIADVTAQRGTVIIEDAAQAHGATQSGAAGSFGLLAGVSFYPGKNLGAYGDAGAVLTESAEHARRIRLLGDHGSERRYEHLTIGFNSRLDALQAVVLRAKLRGLAAGNQARRQAASRYAELLADLPEVILPRTAPGNEHVWHLYAIRVPRRDDVLRCLHDEGIGAGIHYPVPVHLQPAFRHLGYGPGDFPVAEAAAMQLLSLPLYPQITQEQQVRVAEPSGAHSGRSAPVPDLAKSGPVSPTRLAITRSRWSVHASRPAYSTPRRPYFRLVDESLPGPVAR